MTVAVTGATGFVGRALVARLLAAGEQVQSLARSGPRTPPDDPHHRVVSGDLSDPGALEALVAGADAVVHLAAYVHRETRRAADGEACFAINREGTRRLISAIERAGRGPRVVFASTAAVYGASFAAATESSACRPATDYARSKLEAEDLLRQAAARDVLKVCVLRPAMVFGPEGPGNLEPLIRLVRRGMVPLVDGGRNRKSLVHVEDLAAVALAVLDHSDNAATRIYNVASEAPLTMREVVESLARGFAVAPRVIVVPGVLAGALGFASRVINRASAGLAPDLSRRLETYRSEAWLDAGLMRHELGVACRPAAPALEAMAREQRARGL